MDENEKKAGPVGILTGIVSYGDQPFIGLSTLSGAVCIISPASANHLINCLIDHLDALGFSPEDFEEDEAPPDTEGGEGGGRRLH